jgi:lipopolysaccharide exporter
MTSVRRALALSFAERYALIALSLASNILLARLLTPEQIGIYSVSLAVIGIAQVLRDFGVGNFLIQEKNLSEAHIRTAFGISLVIGVVLFLVTFVGAPWAGRFYGEAQMVATLQISALNFVVLPFCSISLALLRRGMQFQRLLIVTLVSAAAGFMVTIWLAYAGFGPNSMAIGALVGNIFIGAGARLARPDRRILLPAFSEWRALMNFGARSSAASVVTTISMDINDLVLGKILGFAPVALLSRAQGIMNLFHRDLMGAIRGVAFPAFARAHRDGKDLESQHTAWVGAITAFSWPFYAFASLFPLELLRFLFGIQWDAAAPLVPWFCLAGAIGAPCGLVIPLVIAIGRIDIATTIDLVVQPLRACLIVIGVLMFPLIQVPAILLVVVAACAAPYNYWMKGKAQPNDLRALFRILLKSLAVTVISIAGPVIIVFSFPRAEPMGGWGLLVAAVVCCISWPIALLLVHHPLTKDPISNDLLRRARSLFTGRVPP